MAKGESAWLQTLRRFVDDLTASDVSEFEVAQKEFRLRVRRNATALPVAASRLPAEPTGIRVPAPFTGIFYRSPSPTSEAYVREGDWVEAGAVVGMIETMKIFNEVKVEQSGRIEKIVVQSGQLVHAGDPLVLLAPGKPSADS